MQQVGPSAIVNDPLFYYRPYWNEHQFLRDYPRHGPFDAAILRGRHLAPHPAGSTAARRGESGRELADALIESGGAFVVDPDTPILAAGGPGDFPSQRIALMPQAEVLTLPLSRLSFANPNDRRSFVGACLGQQAGAQVLTAPYFTFERHGDGWYGLNLELLSDARAIAAGRPLAVFAQVPLQSLVAGDLALSAPDYASAGAELVFLRVAGFDPQQANRLACEAYRRALEAFAEVGVPAVADAVGRFGLVLASTDCGGFSCGARHHKFVSASAIYDAEDIGSDPMYYEVPHRWYELTHAQARADAGHGVLPACPLGNCGALAGSAGSADLKEHMVHYFTREVRAMAAGGAATARQSLIQYPRGANAAWAAAL